MNNEGQPIPSLLHEKTNVVKIVRTIHDIQDTLSDARTKPNFGEIKRRVRQLIDRQIQKLSGISPELVEGVRYLIFENNTRLELKKHEADFQSGFITEQQFADYQRLFEDTLRNRARSIPKSNIDRLRFMQLTATQRKAIRDKRHNQNNKEKRKKYHYKYGQDHKKQKAEARRLRRSDPKVKEREKTLAIRRAERKERKLNEAHSHPIQVFPDNDK